MEHKGSSQLYQWSRIVIHLKLVLLPHPYTMADTDDPMSGHSGADDPISSSSTRRKRVRVDSPGPTSEPSTKKSPPKKARTSQTGDKPVQKKKKSWSLTTEQVPENAKGLQVSFIFVMIPNYS